MVVAPADASIFSEQAFAFNQSNLNAVSELLARSKSDGGGNTFTNLIPAAGEASRVWAQVDGNAGIADANSVAPRFHHTAGGFSGGADGDVGGNNRVGIAFAYSHDALHDDAGGRAATDVFRASVYASQPVGLVVLSEVGSYSKAWITTDRSTGAGDANAHYTSDAWTGAFQAAAPFTLGEATVSPAAGVVVSRLMGGTFGERGILPAAFLLTGRGQDITYTSPYAKIGISREFGGADGLVFIPDAEVGYRYDQGGKGQAFTLTAADGTVFTGNRVALQRSSALLNAGLTAHQGAWSVYIKYRGQVSGDYVSHSGWVGVRFAF